MSSWTSDNRTRGSCVLSISNQFHVAQQITKHETVFVLIIVVYIGIENRPLIRWEWIFSSRVA